MNFTFIKCIFGFSHKYIQPVQHNTEFVIQGHKWVNKRFEYINNEIQFLSELSLQYWIKELYKLEMI